jgi:hypothetical protein
MYGVNNYRLAFNFINSQVRKTFKLYISYDMLLINKTIVLWMPADFIKPYE